MFEGSLFRKKPSGKKKKCLKEAFLEKSLQGKRKMFEGSLFRKKPSGKKKNV